MALSGGGNPAVVLTVKKLSVRTKVSTVKSLSRDEVILDLGLLQHRQYNPGHPEQGSPIRDIRNRGLQSGTGVSNPGPCLHSGTGVSNPALESPNGTGVSYPAVSRNVCFSIGTMAEAKRRKTSTKVSIIGR